MEIKETVRETDSETLLAKDDFYYSYIFKKTEKIVCSVFYIVNLETEKGHKDVTLSDIEQSATELLRYAVDSLRSQKGRSEPELENMVFAYIELESRLRILHAARHLTEDVLQVFLHEIGGVLRALKKYLKNRLKNPILVPGDTQLGTPTVTSVHQRRVRTKAHGMLPGAPMAGGSSKDRRSRILEVLREKGQQSIKDISSVITDCSEKTIQRELNALIKDNVIVREGERRWSKYSLSS